MTAIALAAPRRALLKPAMATLAPLLGALLVSTPSAATSGRDHPPRLGVLLVVDQMRADYLLRFASDFHDGFARILAEAARFDDCELDHAITETAPGHATLSTGVQPSRHGVVGNEWWDRSSASFVRVCDDATAARTGEGGAPTCSPCSLRRDGLGDWLKAVSPTSKVLATALKARSSALLGGLHADAAYWLWDRTGRFVSSAHYGLAYPAWVDAFNRSGLAEELIKEGRQPSDGADPGPERLLGTPSGEALVLRFAEELVAKERLGLRGVTDLLLIGCSAGDDIGHRYGPDSPEIQDYYLRLDEYLGDFLRFLDRRMGRDGYVLVLTSDHGVAPLPELAGGARLTAAADAALLGAVARLDRELGVPLRPVGLGSAGIFLDFEETDRKGVPRAAVRRRLAESLRALDFVADAYTADELVETVTHAGRPFLEAYRLSFDPERSPDVYIRYPPDRLAGAGNAGTAHLGPYAWNTHVPLALLGAGVPRGLRVGGRVRAVDVAPTLAELLHLVPPADLDGRSLVPLLARPSASPVSTGD